MVLPYATGKDLILLTLVGSAVASVIAWTDVRFEGAAWIIARVVAILATVVVVTMLVAWILTWLVQTIRHHGEVDDWA